MAGLDATECHLWLNLMEISEKDKTFLLDALISQSGLFSDALTAVILLWLENKILSLRVINLPGSLNHGADHISRPRMRPRKWRLHPQLSTGFFRSWTFFHRARCHTILSGNRYYGP